MIETDQKLREYALLEKKVTWRIYEMACSLIIIVGLCMIVIEYQLYVETGIWQYTRLFSMDYYVNEMSSLNEFVGYIEFIPLSGMAVTTGMLGIFWTHLRGNHYARLYSAQQRNMQR